MTRNRRRQTADQILRRLAEGHMQLDTGQSLEEVCRAPGDRRVDAPGWLAQYGGMKADEAHGARGENARLKKVLAEAEVGKSMLKELAEGNF